MDLSVIVCCYNSENRISPTLRSLAFQKCKFNWEIIIVDNNSTDNTSMLCTQIWKELQSKVELKIIKEEKPGLSAARKKGVIASKGELILFCDDDNQLNESYVENAVLIMNEDPEIGALCGYNAPVTEIPPPEIIKQNWTAYACGHRGMSSTYLTSKIVPWGAGLVMRSHFLKKLFSLNFESFLSDRKGSSLNSGGDTEYCYLAKLVGYKWKYDTRLKLSHMIPSERLNLNHLNKLYLGFGKASVVIEWYYRFGNKKAVFSNLKWWKVYLREYWRFLFKKEQTEQLSFFQQGYIQQLKNERTVFHEKRELLKTIINQLNND